MPRVFTRIDAWTGGSYDLGLELGPRDDSRLRRALSALWSHPELEGCYLRPDVEPQEQQRVEPNASPDDGVLHGVVRISGMLPIAARTVPVRFNKGVDWLYFSIPLGSLGHVTDVGAFPVSDPRSAWQSVVDDWLCRLGRHVFDAVPFELGLVGWDGGDFSDARSYHAHGVPEERWVGYLVPAFRIGGKRPTG